MRVQIQLHALTSQHRRARVFISCGQRPKELALAQELATELAARGFAPWVALDHQSLQSIRENVFNRLREFEYFIFVDFLRDQLVVTGKKKVFRGSLFSHQELAIASFLDMPIIAFRERGVAALDGLIGHLQSNCSEFRDRNTLVKQILERVEKSGWSNSWRNALEIEVTSEQLSDRTKKMNEGGRVVRWAFLTVKNRHRHKAAEECYGYLLSAKNLATGKREEFPFSEQKWSGYIFPNARIPHCAMRRFDAFYIAEQEPMRLLLPRFTDSNEFQPSIYGPDPWELTYEVVCSNLPAAQIVVKVEFANDLANVRIRDAASKVTTESSLSKFPDPNNRDRLAFAEFLKRDGSVRANVASSVVSISPTRGPVTFSPKLS